MCADAGTSASNAESHRTMLPTDGGRLAGSAAGLGEQELRITKQANVKANLFIVPASGLSGTFAIPAARASHSPADGKASLAGSGPDSGLGPAPAPSEEPESLFPRHRVFLPLCPRRPMRKRPAGIDLQSAAKAPGPGLADLPADTNGQ